MLYQGNFSYNDDTDSADNYCLMPTIVEAPTPEDALDRFADLFERLHATTDLLEGAHEVFLDSLVELESTPEEAVLTQWQKIVPAVDGLCSITSALPETDQVSATAYGWNDDDDEDEDDTSDDEEEPVEADEAPFLTFDE
ncbi:MAG: hypothetical protein LKI25_04580 [Atopobiaceae bacterium]|nr:hypothetical protein [Atopobiaceae bacterium]MCI2173484.1 hypothetical protein [Atopobiaceae bacterium]MCI2207479.1 hypothetical protein [Atopobiaceae bacterium]